MDPSDNEAAAGMRIGDADRERVAQRLNSAVADGRISLLELDERLTKGYAAKYEVELQHLVADLPGGQLAVPHSITKPVSLSSGYAVAGFLQSAPSGAMTVLRGGLGGLKRFGSWPVPERMRVVSGFGSVKLDYTDAQFAASDVQLELMVGVGSVKIRVPPGSTLDLGGLTPGVGSVKENIAPATGDGPHFRIFGRVGLGSVKISSRRW